WTRGPGLDGSRSATDLSAVTCASSRTAARVDDPPAGAAVAADGATAVGGRLAACCEPMIHPAIRPNNTPATPKARASDFMLRQLSTTDLILRFLRVHCGGEF